MIDKDVFSKVFIHGTVKDSGRLFEGKTSGPKTMQNFAIIVKVRQNHVKYHYMF